MPRNSRMRSRPPAASARHCRNGSATYMPVPNASRRCLSIRRRSNAISCPPAAPHAKEPPHERRNHAPTLGSDRRDRRDAASGVRLARRLGRRRQPRRAAGRARHLASARTHGVQGHQAAHRPADRRGDRGGRRRPQCRDQRRDRPRTTRACCAPTCRSRSTCCPTSCRTRPSIRRNCSASRTSSCRRSAPPRTRPTISSSTSCRRPRSPASRSAARSSAPARPCAPSTASGSPPISPATIAPPTWWWRPPARSITRALVEQVEKQFASFAGPAAPVPEPAHFAGGTYIESARSRAGACGAGDAGRAAARSQSVQHAGLHQRARRRHVVAPVPGGARDPRALLLDLRVPRALFATPACSASMPAPMPPTCRS